MDNDNKSILQYSREFYKEKRKKSLQRKKEIDREKKKLSKRKKDSEQIRRTLLIEQLKLKETLEEIAKCRENLLDH